MLERQSIVLDGAGAVKLAYQKLFDASTTRKPTAFC